MRIHGHLLDILLPRLGLLNNKSIFHHSIWGSSTKNDLDGKHKALHLHRLLSSYHLHL